MIGAAEPHTETSSTETHAEDERVLGVDVQSAPLIVLAVLAGFGLAARTGMRFGRARRFLLAAG